MPHPETTFIEIDGETRSLSEWARLYGKSIQVIIGRINAGWDKERAVTAPVGKYRKKEGGDDKR
jgi:hypothetical protein